MVCKNCGVLNSEDATTCTNCGAPLDELRYKPITMWGYFGYEILFSIPCVGLIFLIVFSLGGTKNINLRNFARSYFCYTIILLVVIGIIIACGGFTLLGGSSYH